MSDIVERLAPCPFCGGRAEIYGGLFPPLGPRYGVTCRGECKTFLDCRCVHQAEAIAAWNRRSDATITALREEVKRARFSPLGDNHHNALACPYCNPKQLDPEAELTALRRRVVELGGAIVARVHERQTLLSTSAPVRALATLINEIKETTDG